MHKSCDAFCKQSISYFASPVVFGLIAYLIYNNHKSDNDLYVRFRYFFQVVKIADYIFVPRSLGELSQIDEREGLKAFSITAVFCASCLLSFFFAFVLLVSKLRKHNIVLSISSKKQIISSVIVSSGFIFRPVTFERGSFVLNYFDTQGVYFVREGLVYAVVYFYLTTLLLNAAVYAGLTRRNTRQT